MKKKRPEIRQEVYSNIERRWQVMDQPAPRTSATVNTLMFVLVLAVLFAAAYLGRARIGALWQQVTGKAPPVWVMPEKPEREGPEVEGRDF